MGGSTQGRAIILELCLEGQGFSNNGLFWHCCMQKVARNVSKDPKIESVLQMKDKLNAEISWVIHEWIRAKRSWNGYETDLTGNKKTKITDKLPEQIFSTVQYIKDMTDQAYNDYHAMEVAQLEVAQSREASRAERLKRLQQELEGTASSINSLEKFAIAPRVVERFVSHIKAPFIGDGAKWVRLKALRKMADLEQILSEVESDILSSSNSAVVDALYGTKSAVTSLVSDLSPLLTMMFSQSAQEVLGEIDNAIMSFSDLETITAKKTLEKLHYLKKEAEKLSRITFDIGSGKKINDLKKSVQLLLGNAGEDQIVDIEPTKDVILDEILQYKKLIESVHSSNKIEEDKFLKIIAYLEKFETQIGYILSDTKDADRKLAAIKDSLNSFVASNYKFFYPSSDDDGTMPITDATEPSEGILGLVPSRLRDKEQRGFNTDIEILANEIADLIRSLKTIQEYYNSISRISSNQEIKKNCERIRAMSIAYSETLKSIRRDSKTDLGTAISYFQTKRKGIEDFIKVYLEKIESTVSHPQDVSVVMEQLTSEASTRIERWLRRQKMTMLDWSDLRSIRQTCDQKIRQAKISLTNLMKILESETNLDAIKQSIIEFIYPMIDFIEAMKNLADSYNNISKATREESRGDGDRKKYYSVIPYTDINDIDKKKVQLTNILAGLNG